MNKIAVSLTPDFSVTGGRCKKNTQDDCSMIVGDRTTSGGKPAGGYYVQMYNIYQEAALTQGSVLTDVTPWSASSPAANCSKATEAGACPASCCEWKFERCMPRYPHRGVGCIRPDPGLCTGDVPSGCNPPPGGSLYDTKYTPKQAAKSVASIFAQRIGTRCHAGGASIETLNATTFWQTFRIIFSYEPWSAPGPPLYLMGNPARPYDNLMWSTFVANFKAYLSLNLRQMDKLQG